MKISRQTLKALWVTYRTSVICFLLSLGIFTGGAVSYARYVSEGKFFERPGVGTFALSALVDDVSALSFTNMAFWGGLEDIGVSMNSLRTVDLSVDNYVTDEQGNKRITEVALGYTLLFASPTNFANKLAIQLSDDGGTVLTPQIVLADLLKSVDAEDPVGTFETTQPKYNGKNYSGTDENGNVSTAILFDVTLDTETGIYTATARGHNDLEITLEPFVMEDMEQTLYFRLWDVEEEQSTHVTEEGGTLLPPLKINYVDDIECYKISVTRSDFTFPAGTLTERDFQLTLSPTDALLDSHLGGYLMTEENGVMSNATVITPDQPLDLSTVIETAKSTNKTNDVVTLMGHIPNHRVGDVVEIDVGRSTKETLYHDAYSAIESDDGIDANGQPIVEQSSVTYYQRRSSTNWVIKNSETDSNVTHRIRKELVKITTTEYEFEVKVAEASHTVERLTTVQVITDGNNVITKIIQNGESNSSITSQLKDAFVRRTVSVEYVEKTYYEKKSYGSWVTNTSDFSRMPDRYKPAALVGEHEHPIVYDAVALTAEEIEVLLEVDAVQALLVNKNEQKTFTREVFYESTTDEITPKEIASTDASIPTDPFKTHLENGIQKYYLATSYSKNYPFFVKILLRQIQD